MGECRECRWWEEDVPQHNWPAQGNCNGNRLHVLNGEVHVETRKSHGFYSLVVPEGFGCNSWTGRRAAPAGAGEDDAD